MTDAAGGRKAAGGTAAASIESVWRRGTCCWNVLCLTCHSDPLIFVAPALQNLDYNLVECQALVLAPTRELAQQIEKVRKDAAAICALSTASRGAGLRACSSWQQLERGS